MAKMKKERELLVDALHDLERELKALQAAKREMESKFNNSSGKLDTLKEQEIKLRNLISLSMKKEAALLNRKTALKDKLAELNKKIDKVKAVERELKEV